MYHAKLNVEGLESDETKIRVKRQIEGIVGVHDVAINHDENSIDVFYDDTTSDKEISSHLHNNGYKVTDISNTF